MKFRMRVVARRGERGEKLVKREGWQSRTWTAGLVRKGLLQGGTRLPFDKPAKLRASRDGFKAGWAQSRTGRKRDGLNRGILKLSPEREIRHYGAPLMVVSGSMMLPVSQASLVRTGGASSNHYK
ncbi:Uncharacterized protein Rs2_33280 [Raphanus sativus]|nr:Uncharacterized protein Rs2_33280 [Raphanus sativus]